jgi:hypothetical protein
MIKKLLKNLNLDFWLNNQIWPVEKLNFRENIKYICKNNIIMALKFFHTPKNRQFSFKPRYYDEQKEDLENRINQIKRELGQNDPNNDKKEYSANIKRRMKGTLRRSHDAQQKSNIRLILIIIVLSLVAYYVFFK